MVEEVSGASQKIVGIQNPTFDGNGHAELVLFIALARQRDEVQLLLVLNGAQSGAGKRAEGRRLIKMSVKAAEDPVQFGNSHGSASARASGIFCQCAGKMRLAEPGIEREPRS